MLAFSNVWPFFLLVHPFLISAQNLCYFGPGEENRAFQDLVPCFDSGQSSCCLLGDVCLGGNACWDPETEVTYQYGCTDMTYKDRSCPSKCEFNTSLSNWVGLEYCGSFAPNTWTCNSPESCGKFCPSSVPWNQSLEPLTANACSDMKSDARVALYAPSTIQALLSLPSTYGGSTGYFPPGSTTVVNGYTPAFMGTFTTYPTVPTTPVLIAPSAGPETLISTATTSGSVATTTAAAGSSSSNPSVPPPTSALTTEAKIAIGVGITGGFCIIAGTALACLSFRRRLRLQQQLRLTQYPYQPPMHAVPYFAGQENASWFRGFAQPGAHQPHTGYVEISADSQPKTSALVELSSDRDPHELESKSVVSTTDTPLHSGPTKSESESVVETASTLSHSEPTKPKEETPHDTPRSAFEKMAIYK